jgi:uncharacterized membrane protein HdeD (DUF308 family)
MNIGRFNNIDLPQVGKNCGWFMLWGVILIALGTIAISAATLTTLATVIFLGVLIFLSGVIQVVDAVTLWLGKWRGFFTHVIIGLLYLAVGLILIESPITSSASITLVLGIFYVALGLARIFYSSSTRLPRWKWVLFNGLISLLLGILILANWPASGMLIIGLFVGIDLLFCGIAYLSLGFACRSLT